MKNLKIITCSLIIAMIPGFAKAITPSDQGIYINDNKVEISGVKHQGFNYFRLRDIAYALKDTPSKFEVGYNKDRKSVVINAKTEYTGDKISPEKLGENLKPVEIPIEVNKTLSHIEVVNVDGYNYFRLRDLAVLVGFEIKYNPEDKKVEIITEKENEDEDLATKLKKSKTPIIYGRDSCPACIKLKAYLDKNKIEYEFRSTEEPKNKDELISMGFNSVPQMFYDGEVYGGYNEDELKRIFEK